MTDCTVLPPSSYNHIQYKIPHWGIPTREIYTAPVCANLEIHKTLRRLPLGARGALNQGTRFGGMAGNSDMKGHDPWHPYLLHLFWVPSPHHLLQNNVCGGNKTYINSWVTHPRAPFLRYICVFSPISSLVPTELWHVLTALVVNTGKSTENVTSIKA